MPYLVLLVLVSQTLQPLAGWESARHWRLHADGGGGATVEQAPRGIRVRYRDQPPHWGNLVGACTVPANAVALRLRVTKHASAPNAAMHIWLMEPDGDGWLQEVRAAGRSLGQWPRGEQQVRLPVSGFQFQPRGPGSRQMPGADRLLLGSNYGDLDVTITEMAWEVVETMNEQPLPRSEPFSIQRRPRGSIGVLDMGQALPAGYKPAHSPAELARALAAQGFGVTTLRAGDLADTSRLTRTNFDAVVLPHGPYFPAAARTAFLAYLKSGGNFLSLGGYAFDSPVLWNGSAWVERSAALTAAQTGQDASAEPPMNTRFGTRGDAMTFHPDQIPVFDPAHMLTEVVRIGGTRAEGVTGFAASALIGLNNPVFPPVYRRVESLVDTYDSAGQPRGSALALIRNFDGPFKGSTWAISGITSPHKVLLGTPARLRLLARTMDSLVRPVCISALETNYASYRIGEQGTASATVANFGRAPVSVEVSLTLGSSLLKQSRLTLGPGETRRIEATFSNGANHPAFRLLKAVAADETGIRDAYHAAICLWKPEQVARSPRFAWSENHLTVDGKARFLIGTNQTGMVFYSRAESPLVWERDLRHMRANGLRVLRILHFSPFAARGYEGQGQHTSLELRNPPERLRRQMDAIVQIAGSYGVGIFLSLHDWLGVGLTEEELAAQKEWNRFWAARYREAPHVFFDIQNEPAVDVPERPDIVALWNGWLRNRYGSDDALRAAWRISPPEKAMPEVPLASGTQNWDDMRTADRKRFEAEVLNRWVLANAEGIRAGNPAAPLTVGYLPSMPPADKILGTRHLDFSNMHFYGTVEEFPLEFKLTDRSHEGKGFSVGEFGAQEAHGARNAGQNGTPDDVSINRFRQTVLNAAGLGASFALNWCWKELDEMVFPWGLLHRGAHLPDWTAPGSDGYPRQGLPSRRPVPKPWLHAFRDTAALLAKFELKHAPPTVYLLVPDSHRIGPQFNAIHAALQTSVSHLLDSGVRFEVLNEEGLMQVPPSCRALVWPLPYCPDDATFERVRAWVEAGGHLYVSGDIGFDRTRQPTRRARYAALGLPDREPVPPFAEGAYRPAPAVQARIGRGTVTYVPYPLELRRNAEDARIYEAFLRSAGVQPVALEAEGANVRLLTRPLAAGGTLHVLVRRSGGAPRVAVTVPGTRVTLELRPEGAAAVVVDGQGRVAAAESQGRLLVNGREIARAEDTFGLVSEDLASSPRLTLYPHLNRAVTVRGKQIACRLGQGATPIVAGQ